MKKDMGKRVGKLLVFCLAGIIVLITAACGAEGESGNNLIAFEEDDEKVINLFGPMEKSNPNAENIARTAFDLTVAIAEEKLGLTVEYRTYTAENYQEKT